MASGVARTALSSLTTSQPFKRKLLLGRSWASNVPKAARIYVRTMEFDKNLKMYFSHQKAYYASDPSASAKPGDFVLIEELAEPMTRDITHNLLRVVYPCGDVTDPITGLKCVEIQTREEMEREDQLWGKNPTAFDYDSAPPRGWQEGRKDWSHKVGIKKWNDWVDKEEPEAVV